MGDTKSLKLILTTERYSSCTSVMEISRGTISNVLLGSLLFPKMGKNLTTFLYPKFSKSTLSNFIPSFALMIFAY